MNPHLKKRMNYLHSSSENVNFTGETNGSLETKKDNYLIPSAIDSFENHFERAAEPLEEIGRLNPTLIPLLKLVRKGYEEACHKIIAEEKRALVNETIHKLKQELSLARREANLLQKEKENIERESSKHMKENAELQGKIKQMNLENKTFKALSKKYNELERKYK